jgi:hypothetical protein
LHEPYFEGTGGRGISLNNILLGSEASTLIGEEGLWVKELAAAGLEVVGGVNMWA